MWFQTSPKLGTNITKGTPASSHKQYLRFLTSPKLEPTSLKELLLQATNKTYKVETEQKKHNVYAKQKKCTDKHVVFPTHWPEASWTPCELDRHRMSTHTRTDRTWRRWPYRLPALNKTWIPWQWVRHKTPRRMTHCLLANFYNA